MALITIKNEAINLDANEIPNLDASKITSGTFSDNRISASSVSQHAQSFDDNKIVNDISTLALRQASNENKSAYNTNSMYVDVFQDSTGITNLTNANRSSSEYMESATQTLATKYNYNFEESSGTNSTNTGTGGGITTNPLVSHHSTTRSQFGSRSLYGQGSSTKQFTAESLNYTGDFTFQCFMHTNGVSDNSYRYGCGIEMGNSGGDVNLYKWRSGFGSGYWVIYRDGSNNAFANNGDSAWWHFAVARSGNTFSAWINGTRQHTWTQDASSYPLEKIFVGPNGTTNSNQYYDGFVFDERVRSGFEPSNSSITVPTSQPSNVYNTAVSATGSFESNAITAPSSTNKMGAIITYQDNAGTNALNTDIVLKLSADGGSNYTTATLTAMPDFSSGIKMAKVNDLTIANAGTSLKYKIEFANQASGSKEARIRGVSLQY